VTPVAALVHATDHFATPFLEDIQATARSVGVQIHPVVVQGDEELDGAFATMVIAQAGAVIIQPNLSTQRAADLAVQHHLPTMSLWRVWANGGGLMSYGVNEEAAYRRVAPSGRHWWFPHTLRDDPSFDQPCEFLGRQTQ